MSIFPVSAIPPSYYEIDNSLRFNDDDSAYLSTSMSGTGGRTTFTYSGWVKLGNTGVVFDLLSAPHSASLNGSYLQITSSGYFYSHTRNYDPTGVQGTFNGDCTSDMIFRDPTAWYHIVFAYDSTLATASDRQKLYVNGDLQTFSSQDIISQHNEQYLGSEYTSLIGKNYGTIGGIDGYLAEVNFIDGQALTPSDFGEFGDYGEFKPIKYSGTYGTNGFYLDFKTSSTLGNDSSSNSNNWTLNNLSATDQMIDTPTNNYATLNPLSTSVGTYTEGNTKYVAAGAHKASISTISMPSTGKWYFEAVLDKAPMDGTFASVWSFLGLKDSTKSFNYNSGDFFGAIDTGHYVNNSAGSVGSFTTPVLGTILAIAYDADAGTATIYRDNVAVATSVAVSVSSENMVAFYSNYSSLHGTMLVNFGQDSSFAGNKTAQGNQDSNDIGDFYYTPPSGFLALCTKNLTAPAVIPSEHFNIITWSGDGNNNRSLTGVGFQPDFVWFKARNVAHNHRLEDSVRGASAGFLSSERVIGYNTAVEETGYGQVVGFGSDGFTVGFTSQDIGGANFSGHNYVAWNWKAGGAGTSVAESGTGDGSINAHTYSANTDAGFSIVKYEGRGDEVTAGFHTKVGHGLSVAPEMVIIKSRDNARGWAVMTDGISYAGVPYANVHLRLDTTASTSAALYVTSIAPDSTHFYVGDDAIVNAVSENYIAYCFHSVDGYSKVGSYTGNGSADGTFVHTGFRPAYVMLKASSRTGRWIVMDSVRDASNVVYQVLSPSHTGVEDVSASYWLADFTANGFKLRYGADTEFNQSGQTYIYLAFAESPFKHTNAR